MATTITIPSGGGAVTVAAAGALDGDGTSGDPLAVNVDGVTVTIVGNELVAAGGGTIGGSIASTQVAVGTGVNTIGGYAGNTWHNTLQTSLLTGTYTPAGNFAGDGLGPYGVTNLLQMTSTVNPSLNQTGDPAFFAHENDVLLEGSHNLGHIENFSTDMISNNTGTVQYGLGFGNHAYFENAASGTVNVLWGHQAEVSNGATGTIETAYNYRSGISNAGTITTGYHYYGTAMGGQATNAYAFWSDEQGVFRIRADNTFDSVYQAIPALYNPQFTKYTPGAANYERIVEQWNGNIAEFGTEKGGTGVLRALKLIGASVELPALTNGAALKTDTTTAHTALLQAYDVDGTAYKTFGTLTNGNTPNFTIAPPSGGTVNLKGTLATTENATTGLAAGVLAALTNATIVITDGAGQVYRVPCII